MRGDRRRHVRFELTKGTLAVLTAQGKRFMRVGSIANLSAGGAAFRYGHWADPVKRSLRLHLFGPRDSHLAVPGLPCTIVLDTFSALRHSNIPSGFCSMAFDSLSHPETVMLQEFIRRLTLEPSSQTSSEQPLHATGAPIQTMDKGDALKATERQGLPSPMPQILVVDDEAIITKIMSRILEMQGYRVISKTCPKEALEVFRSNPGEIDLIITDYWMAPMTGAELAREVLRTRPDLPLILFTGNSEMMTERLARDFGFRKVAMKPLGRDDLIKLVRSVLDQDGLDMKAAAGCSG